MDAIEAYRVAIDKLKDSESRAQLGMFMVDHQRHVRELRPIVERLGEKPSDQPDAKGVLVKGKVFLASLVNDKAILQAMKSNEEDTNTAYERACARQDLPADIRTVLERGLADERRHREYLVTKTEETTAPVASR
jgi:uncharacterized protein (TIGR02284 family)